MPAGRLKPVVDVSSVAETWQKEEVENLQVRNEFPAITFVTLVFFVTTPLVPGVGGVGKAGGRLGCFAVFFGRDPDGPATAFVPVCPDDVGTVAAGFDPPAVGAVVVLVAAPVFPPTFAVVATVVVVVVVVVVVSGASVAFVLDFGPGFLPRTGRLSAMMK